MNSAWTPVRPGVVRRTDQGAPRWTAAPIPTALGLLSLMVLHDARRAARMDPAGDRVTLEDEPIEDDGTLANYHLLPATRVTRGPRPPFPATLHGFGDADRGKPGGEMTGRRERGRVCHSWAPRLRPKIRTGRPDGPLPVRSSGRRRHQAGRTGGTGRCPLQTEPPSQCSPCC